MYVRNPCTTTSSLIQNQIFVCIFYQLVRNSVIYAKQPISHFKLNLYKFAYLNNYKKIIVKKMLRLLKYGNTSKYGKYLTISYVLKEIENKLRITVNDLKYELHFRKM